MGLHFTHHSLVICTPFASHQLFGNFLHLVLAWGVGGEQKNLLSIFPTHSCVGPVNLVFFSPFKVLHTHTHTHMHKKRKNNQKTLKISPTKHCQVAESVLIRVILVFLIVRTERMKMIAI